jgi:hypothetical protein
MKNKITFRFPLFLILWMVLGVSVEVSRSQSPRGGTQVHVEQAKLCDLFSNLPRYKDKIFDVDAIYVVGLEMGSLDSEARSPSFAGPLDSRLQETSTLIPTQRF